MENLEEEPQAAPEPESVISAPDATWTQDVVCPEAEPEAEADFEPETMM